MKLSDRVKPLSHLKAHAPKIIRGLAEGQDPVVITVHGEAKAVLQDVGRYEQTQETLALLKVLALTNRRLKQARFVPPARPSSAFAHALKADRARCACACRWSRMPSGTSTAAVTCNRS